MTESSAEGKLSAETLDLLTANDRNERIFLPLITNRNAAQ